MCWVECRQTKTDTIQTNIPHKWCVPAHGLEEKRCDSMINITATSIEPVINQKLFADWGGVLNASDVSGGFDKVVHSAT